MKRTINIELLDRFMRRGKVSTKEQQKLINWLHSENSHKELDDYYSTQWQKAKDSPEIDIDIQERMYCQIKSCIHSNNPSKKHVSLPNNRFFKQWISYAAILALSVFLGLSGYLYTTLSNKKAGDYIVEVDKGQRANITLPDGTKVWLNSYSTLKYSADYNIKNRLVQLSGEAYFEVAKNKDSRFIVNAGGLDIEALGTSFEVKAYPDETTITTSLFSGKVKVSSNAKSIILTKGQQAIYELKSGQLKKHHPTSIDYVNMWRNDELYFNRHTLSEITSILNRMYNVKIIFESEQIKNYRFSGVIRNKSLDNVIEIISLTVPIEYRIENDTLYISEKTNKSIY